MQSKYPSDIVVWGQEGECKLLFVDISFGVSIRNQQPHVSAELGCFFLSKPRCAYVKTLPLSSAVLENHAKSIKVELDSAPPQAMAGMLAQALLQKDITGKLEGTCANLELYYADLEERGVLSLEVGESSSQLDELVMGLYHRDLTRSVPDVRDWKARDHLEEERLSNKFDAWWNKARGSIEARNSAVQARPANPHQPKQQRAVRPLSAIHGHVVMGSKKRKKNKEKGIVYAKHK